jgi:hypothetical protein
MFIEKLEVFGKEFENGLFMIKPNTNTNSKYEDGY